MSAERISKHSSDESKPELHRGTAETATAPFNLSSADVVFLTTDNVEYRLHKNILSIASPFFNDMFTLVQPSQGITRDNATDERIPVTEDSETFDDLMRLLYPVADPPLTDRHRVEQMLEAALKYQLQEATDILRAAWRLFIPLCPLGIFASACRLRLNEEAGMAAKQCKDDILASSSTNSWEFTFKCTINGAINTEEMAYISAGMFFRLLLYLARGPAPFDDNLQNFLDPGPFFALSRSIDTSQTSGSTTGTAANASLVEPDVTLRCRDGVDVPAHEVIIRLVSASKLLESPIPSCSSSKSTIYEVDADSGTLRILLDICYPFAPADLDTSIHRRLDKIITLAKRYEIEKVEQFIRQRFDRVIISRPTTSYFLAMKWGWAEESDRAARFVAKRSQLVYSYAMEDSSAKIYIDLLKRIPKIYGSLYRSGSDSEGLVLYEL
ncbi:hypothetical protein BDY19DRAFT_1058057 [Irpex rosettiformis]|uniref:Uncharacterized protein n=1 Tax=Irpex rosettiformis TaxID=378272 RepID=A0ACB8TZX5_9APHY|nr:hypothetical protein BDY19DRAFT_1058057 [Irpex rosettiformis]